MTRPIMRPMAQIKQAGFTIVEMLLAATMGLAILTSGFMLYRSQTKMQLRQGDVNEAQLTVDYVTNAVRTMVVSAGGGLPQVATGLRKAANGKGLVTYVNRKNAAASVPDGANTDTADGVIPVSDPTSLVGAGYAFITHDDLYALAQIDTVNVGAKTVKLKNALAEKNIGGADFVYPVEYCSLYVDTAKNLIKSLVGTSAANMKIPLATQIDSLSITYDLSTDGNGAFTSALADTAKVSRVKLYVRVSGAHTLAATTKRVYETIIGIRRGRLYNRAI
jgi:hypothetical protein